MLYLKKILMKLLKMLNIYKFLVHNLHKFLFLLLVLRTFLLSKFVVNLIRHLQTRPYNLPHKHSSISINLSIITPHKILNVCSYHKHIDHHHTNVYVIDHYNDIYNDNLCISFFFSFLVGKILYLIFLTKYQRNLKFCICIYLSF